MELIIRLLYSVMRTLLYIIFILCVCNNLLFKTEDTKRVYDFAVISIGVILLFTM